MHHWDGDFEVRVYVRCADALSTCAAAAPCRCCRACCRCMLVFAVHPPPLPLLPRPSSKRNLCRTTRMSLCARLRRSWTSRCADRRSEGRKAGLLWVPLPLRSWASTHRLPPPSAASSPSQPERRRRRRRGGRRSATRSGQRRPRSEAVVLEPPFAGRHRAPAAPPAPCTSPLHSLLPASFHVGHTNNRL